MGIRVRCDGCGHIGWANKPIKRERVRRSRTNEKKHAQRYGGRVQPRSGAGPAKLDVTYDDDLEEHKETEAGSYRFSVTKWLAARVHALSAGKRHVWVLKFIRPGLPDINLAVLDYDDYQSLKEDARERATENDS